MAIATTIITTVVGVIVGAIKDLWMTKMEEDSKRWDALARKAGLESKDRIRAGKLNRYAAFTRRFIAVALTTAFVVPSIAPLFYPDFSVNIPREVIEGGWKFLFFESPTKKTVEYITLNGYAYTLMFADFYGFIIGFYFGSAGSRWR